MTRRLDAVAAAPPYGLSSGSAGVVDWGGAGCGLGSAGGDAGVAGGDPGIAGDGRGATSLVGSAQRTVIFCGE